MSTCGRQLALLFLEKTVHFSESLVRQVGQATQPTRVAVDPFSTPPDDFLGDARIRWQRSSCVTDDVCTRDTGGLSMSVSDLILVKLVI